MDYNNGQEAEVQNMLNFYADLVENSKSMFKYYLSENIVLDWFGQTVKGQKNVVAFIKSKINPIKHLFKETRSTTKIGFRDTHVIRAPKSTRRILRSSFISPPRPMLYTTPKKQPQPSTSAKRQIGQPNLDGVGRKNETPPNSDKLDTLLESPRKRQKVSLDLDVLESENDIFDVNVKYLTAEGHVEFHRPSTKKIQKETMWQRPCKLHLAYDCGNDIKDSCFYLIIYEGNVKCRRNLMKDFEAEEAEC